MPAFYTALFLVACSSVALGAEPAKLRTLTGKLIEGELVSISDKDIILKGKSAPETVPVADVLDLMLASNPAAPAEGKYTQVELVDGSVLRCKKYALKGKTAELTLVQGLDIKVPLAAVNALLHEAQDAKVREEWHTILSRRGNTDLLLMKDAAGKVNRFEGTFGDADDKGESIDFESTSGTKRHPKMDRIHGMSFLRKSDPDAPALLCKVYDTSGNVLTAARVELGQAGFTVTSVAGAKVVYPRPQVTRLDYSRGKLAYLSDLEPVKVQESSNVEGIDHYHRDKSLDDGPLRLLVRGDKSESQTFGKGLAMHAYTELVYDLGGQYKEFKGLLGVDPAVGGDSHVKVTIEGDGNQLFAGEVQRRDRAVPLELDIKNVKQLRIVVSSASLFDLGGHVNLADAKVSK